METNTDEERSSHNENDIKAAAPWWLQWASSGTLLFLHATFVVPSIAMVAMVMETEGSYRMCPELDQNQTENKTNDLKFDWNARTQGLILSSYFWGAMLAPAIGVLVIRTWDILAGILAAVAFTLIIPVAAYWSQWAMLVARIFVGVGAGVGIHRLTLSMRKWSPHQQQGPDRIYGLSVLYSVTVIGNMKGLLAAGIMVPTGFLSGWPSIFYVMGLATSVFFLFWLIFSCVNSRMIKKFTYQNEEISKKGRYPWRVIFTSEHFYALCFVEMCDNWAAAMLLTSLPSFLHDKLQLTFFWTTIYTVLPYAASLCPLGYILELARTHIGFPFSNSLFRKLSTLIGSVGPGILLILVPFPGCQAMFIIVLLAGNFLLNNAKLSGFRAIYREMNSECEDFLMACTSSISALGAATAPIFVGFVRETYNPVVGWDAVFVVTGAVYIAGGVVFFVFGSARPQPSWSLEQRNGDFPTEEVTRTEEVPESMGQSTVEMKDVGTGEREQRKEK